LETAVAARRPVLRFMAVVSPWAAGWSFRDLGHQSVDGVVARFAVELQVELQVEAVGEQVLEQRAGADEKLDRLNW
jgi:hypothetical protein